MNQMIIYGRIVRDLEPKRNKDGLTILNFTVAVDRSGKNADKTDFVECTAFGVMAENIAKYFHKGRPILVCGPMECDPYTGKDGAKRYPWRMKVSRWEFSINDPKGGEQPKGEPFEPATEEEEEIPF